MSTVAMLRSVWSTEGLSGEEKQKCRVILVQLLEDLNLNLKLVDLSSAEPPSPKNDLELQVCGAFPLDSTGENYCLPTADDMRKAGVPVVRLSTEVWNYCNLEEGPSSPNYLMRDTKVFVYFPSQEELDKFLHKRVRVVVSLDRNLTHSGVYRLAPARHPPEVRAMHNAIGGHLKRLQEVDAELRALGAVPGRGGLPVLPEYLVDSGDFDEFVATAQRAELHSWLCTRMRVDKRKREAALPALVDERIGLLKALAMFDDGSVRMDRAFRI